MHNYNVGSTLKHIRREKGLKQIDVCLDVCSRTFLSKIENNDSIPNTFVMANILSNLNISFDEFFFLTHNFQKDKFRQKEKICISFFSLRDNYEDLDKIIAECSLFLQNYDDIFISDVLHVAKFLKKIKNKSDFNFEKSELSLIWDRIQKMNMLTLNEIRLVNCILLYFPDEISKNVSQFILKQLKKYQDYSNCSNLIMSIHLNISTLLFYSKNFKEVIDVLDVVIIYAKKHNRFDILYLSKYRKAIINNDVELQKKCHDILLSLELAAYVSELENELIFYNKHK